MEKASERKLSADEKRHLRAYGFFVRLLPGFIRHKFNFTPGPRPKLDEPFLVLANHNTDWDPLMVGVGFKPEHMYFVASEHVFRAGVWSKLLKRYLAPISRMKGSTDASTALSIVRFLRRGFNVCLFAEGNRSFNGMTCDIHPSTAKLVKSCGADVVTYKFEGGYLSSPRWSFTLRRGRMTGNVAGVYTKEQIKAMSLDEINEFIARDLREDAYETQSKQRVPFKGRRLAEGMETALFICPECGKTGGIYTDDDIVKCRLCSFEERYDEYGYLNGSAGFATVYEWDMWQQERLRELLEKAKDETLFSDDGYRLSRLDANHNAEPVAAGELKMSKHELRCGDAVFALGEISDMSMFGRNIIMFTFQNEHYELRPEDVKCSRKYLLTYEFLKNER